MEDIVMQEIRKLRTKITTHPEFDPLLEKTHLAQIRKEADRHSHGLEVEGTNGNHSEELRKLDEAWRYICENGNSIEKACHAHLELARIHPLNDANGRLARLSQNYCLAEKALPAPIIKVSEKPTYIALLRNALKDRHENASSLHQPSIAENAFVNYIGNKVLDSLNGLDNVLEKNRHYELSGTNISNKRDAINLKQRLSHMNSPDQCLHVHLERRNNDWVYRIKGNISQKQIETVVNKTKTVTHNSYDIENIH